MFFIVERNPFNYDGSHWYYKLQGPIKVRDARSLSIDTLTPTPSLIVSLNFATQTIFCTRPDFISDSVPPPVPTETKVFPMDIKYFTEKCSAEQQIRFMFMNTTTGFSWSPERRFWTVATLSESIRHYLHHSNSTLDANIIFQLDVVDEVDEMDEMDEEIEEEEEHFMQEISEEWLEDEEESFEDHEEEEFSEDLELSICQAAPPALVKSLKTELYQQSDQEGEAEGCMICSEELVARVDQVKRLPCSHCFHVDCIDAWFLIKDTCPLCRTKLQAQS